MGYSEGALARSFAVLVTAALCAACAAAPGSSRGRDPSMSPIRPTAAPDSDASRRAVLQASLETLVTAETGALALVRSEGWTWRGAAGLMQDQQPVDPMAWFALASTTKTYVATTVLQLVGEGRLSLDDPVSRLLPDQVRDGHLVKLRHLLNHTSGIADGPLPIRDPLLTEPGTVHRYSNTNYVILGEIVRSWLTRPIEEVVSDRIFVPLGLDDSTYGSAGLRRAPADASWLGIHLSPTVEPETGAGGIESTADDAAAFFQALLGEDLLAEPERDEMLKTVPTATDPFGGMVDGDPQAGLGIFGFTLPCGPAWGHGGDMPQYSNQVLVSPDGSRVVVVARNTNGWPQVNAVAEEMFCASIDANGRRSAVEATRLAVAE